MHAHCLARGHYLEAVHDDGLPVLAAALKAACRTPPRRVDRFIQLALLGSARCVGTRTLDTDCGLYLASALGPLASNIRVQQDLLANHVLPRPFDFIHTLGGSAGFYVASNLGLHGPNQFLGGDHALADAMATALADLAAGVVRQALVGVVEEAPLPLAAQRQRLQVAADATLAEGSHWWLLATPSSDATAPIFHLQRHTGAHNLVAQLDALEADAVPVWLDTSLPLDLAHVLRQRFAQAANARPTALPYHASGAAAWLGDLQTREPATRALVIDRHYLLRCGA
ncbi:MAG TPA: hypothetical protein VF269_00715 [Rhodanobacteraceae bacterium]